EIYRSSSFNDEFQAAHAQIAPALADLKRGLRDNPDQIALLEATGPLVLRRVDIAAAARRLRAAHDAAGIAALTGKAEGRGL
ncbi:CHASE3 domain-containing protein, partial [Acinetobacter baumannii]